MKLPNLDTSYRLCKLLLVVGLTVLATKSVFLVDRFVRTLETEIVLNSRKLYSTLGSIDAIAFNFNENFTKNNDFITKLQASTVGSLTTLSGSLAKSLDVVNSKAGMAFDSISATSDAAKNLLSNTDYSLNGPAGVLDRIKSSITELNGLVAVLIDGKLAGFLEAGTRDLDKIGENLDKLFGKVGIVLEEVQGIGKNLNETSFCIANVSKNVSDVSDHYTKKILHPTKWNQFLNFVSAAGFIASDVLVPWLAVKRVKVVN